MISGFSPVISRVELFRRLAKSQIKYEKRKAAGFCLRQGSELLFAGNNAAFGDDGEE